MGRWFALRRSRAEPLPTQLITSQLSTARELWRFGEPELAERALRLSADQVLTMGRRALEIQRSGEAERLWPDGPKDRAYLLAAVEAVDGKPRPAPRVRRLPERVLPPHLRATEAELWRSANPIADRFHELNGTR